MGGGGLGDEVYYCSLNACSLRQLLRPHARE